MVSVEDPRKMRGSTLQCKDVPNEMTLARQDIDLTASPLMTTSSRTVQLTPRRSKSSILSAKLRKPFKSPLQQQSPGSKKYSQGDDQEEIQRLQHKLDEITDEISELSKEYEEEELQVHIKKLHEYNEIKDVCQMILGKLAELEGRTVKSLHEEYGLDDND